MPRDRPPEPLLPPGRVIQRLDGALTRLVHRLVVAVSLPVIGLYALLMLWAGHALLVLPLAVMAGAIVVSKHHARRTRRHQRSLDIALWPAFVLLLGVVAGQGGSHGTALWWALTLPIAMLVAGGVGSGVAMLALLALTLAGSQALVRAGLLQVVMDPASGPLQPALAIAGSLASLGALLAMAVRWRRQVLQQLDRSLAEAEEAMQVKTRFIANMSHEIRTPLNGIVGAGEMMRLSGLDAGQRQAVQILDHSTRALLSVVNDVLDFSKLEAGQVDLEKVDVDPRSLAHDAAEMFAPQADARGIELWAHVDADVPPHIVSDPHRVRQVLHNLLANAVKFTEHGEVRLHVAVQRDERGHWLRWTVADTGIGVSDQQQAGLFQAFAQADISTTRRYGGTGLGLAISRQIATLLGGHIAVASQVGQGSSFTLNLPAPDLSNVPDLPVPNPPAAAPVTTATDRPRVALCVHSAALANDLCRWIDHSGPPGIARTVAVADSLTALQASGIDLIVADDRAIRSGGIARSSWALMVEKAGLGGVLLLGVSVPTDAVPATLVPIYKPVRPSGLRNALREAWRLLDARRGGVQPDHPLPPARGESFAMEEAPSRAKAAHTAVTMASPGAVPPLDDWQPAQPESTGPVRADGTPCVLVVEDNAVNRVIAQALLEQLGIRTDTAEDGVDALARLGDDSQDFDAVLMDCHMPELDGLEATRRWRETEQRQGRPHIPIIAMTANEPSEAAPACADAGMDDFIAKPFALGDLRSVLSRWIAIPAPVEPA
jgi:signal transduction histidine kinase/ActR/RegA family two-component response regulator